MRLSWREERELVGGRVTEEQLELARKPAWVSAVRVPDALDLAAAAARSAAGVRGTYLPPRPDVCRIAPPGPNSPLARLARSAAAAGYEYEYEYEYDYDDGARGADRAGDGARGADRVGDGMQGLEGLQELQGLEGLEEEDLGSSISHRSSTSTTTSRSSTSTTSTTSSTSLGSFEPSFTYHRHATRNPYASMARFQDTTIHQHRVSFFARFPQPSSQPDVVTSPHTHTEAAAGEEHMEEEEDIDLWRSFKRGDLPRS